MERQEWPAWWEWVWKWQFLIAAVLVLIIGGLLVYRVQHQAQLDRMYQEQGAMMEAVVTEVRSNVWVWLTQDGNGWFRPYKYELRYFVDGQECGFETPTWDWISFATTHKPLAIGDQVDVAVLDGCNARWIDAQMRGRYWTWQGGYASITILAGILLICGHFHWQKHLKK